MLRLTPEQVAALTADYRRRFYSKVWHFLHQKNPDYLDRTPPDQLGPQWDQWLKWGEDHHVRAERDKMRLIYIASLWPGVMLEDERVEQVMGDHQRSVRDRLDTLRQGVRTLKAQAAAAPRS